jgi:hypothetical protein
MMMTIRRMLVLSAALIAWTAAVRATVLIPAEFREVVHGSEIIAYGRITAAEPEWSDNRRQINTVVTLAVGTYLKGSAGETITFRVPGGKIGRYRSTTIGAPSFAEGEEVVLFLVRRDGMPIHVFGLNQGVFRVRLDDRTQQRMVIPPLLARGTGPEAVIRGSAARRTVALESFGAQVRAVMAEAAVVR